MATMTSVSTLGIIVGWIVVLGFAATIVITLLALIGYLPEVKEKYLSRLFVLVVVELAGAGFWLFNQTVQPPEPPELMFQPPIPAEVYLFGHDGEPVPRTELKLGDVTKQIFNDSSKVTFDAPRNLKLASNGDHLLVKSQRDDHQLGKIKVDDLSQEIIDRATSIDRHLALGKYYAQCLDSQKCTERRDVSQAIFHLRRVLQSKQSKSAQQKSAVKSLFFLKHHMDGCEAFLFLVNKIKEHRPRNNLHAEIGDVYQTMCRSAHLNSSQCKATDLQALKSLLRFMSLRDVNPGTDLFNQVVGQASDLAQYLAMTDITSLLDDTKTKLSSRPDGQKFQSLPAEIQKRLEEASDNITETFQCPA